ncbi:hypothetical protein [Nitrosopumilus sp.]|uniref:hypothetical protein n=1 Tax=Nitrosopumilus sp. TaxID=2024843 RepID=UPI0034A00597
MKTRLLKIGVVLFVSGLVIFGTAVSIVEFERANMEPNEMRSIPNLAFYNMSAVLVGIPISLVGVFFVIGRFVSRFPPRYVVCLTSPFFVVMWILFIFSRGS